MKLGTPLLGIILGAAGTVLMYVGFSTIITTALDGSGGSTAPFIALFFLGAAMALAAVGIGLAGLVRGGHRILSALSLLIGLVPAVAVVAILIANR